MKTNYEPNEPMISMRELEKKYNSMIKHYKSTVEGNRINCYTCVCGNKLKTIDMADGVTPFMISCNVCQGMAKSSFYQDIYPEIKPSIMWYRPTIEQCLKLRKKPNLL